MTTAKLRLYVSHRSFGNDPVVLRLRNMLARQFTSYELEILDILEHPVRACEDLISTTPTLLRLSPLPMKRVCGDLSDTRHVLAKLGAAAASG
ncbi:MAG: circadian clock protein KaiB [Thiohalocapsa sp.]|nr:circadian clock protein KaiB [Thiohalocapsa sp.]MCF7989787.1 circadian clock protein KaiB [Thiohalocapsa sp.]